jgi:hypothetical protein
MAPYQWTPIKEPTEPNLLAMEDRPAFEALWNRQRLRLERHGALKPFWDRMGRWWAIETGVIERLYDLSMGTTMVLVERGLDASLIPHGEGSMPPQALVQILEDHQAALGGVMDLIGGTRALSVSWIKELHSLFTRHQETTEAIDQFGRFVRVPLLRGEFKKTLNNPLRPDGAIHEYAPPAHVEAEMDRMVEIYHRLPQNLPEVRSAWLHHAFTQIHPFQDGNGRVARALASIDYLKVGLFPVLVRREDRDTRYIPALEAADSGDLKPLVEFLWSRVQDVLTRAISEAEQVVSGADSLHSILQAASAKSRDRLQGESQARNEMARRIESLATAAGIRIKEKFEQSLVNQVPNLRVFIDPAPQDSKHWFASQILRVAKKHGYWADFHEPRTWVKLRIKNGGTTDLVITLHFVGNPSPGTCAAALFLNHRDPMTPELVGQEPPETVMDIPTMPHLLLSPDENPKAQEHRFLDWVDRAITIGLAHWTRYL